METAQMPAIDGRVPNMGTVTGQGAPAGTIHDPRQIGKFRAQPQPR